MDDFKRAQRVLATGVVIGLVILTVLVLVVGIGIILTMDDSSKSQGGQYLHRGDHDCCAWLVARRIHKGQ